jgi:hypothetical protein
MRIVFKNRGMSSNNKDNHSKKAALKVAGQSLVAKRKEFPLAFLRDSYK